MAKCKEGEIYFAPEQKCVPKMTTKPMDVKETATYGIGAVILGGLAGWVLGRNSAEEQRHPHDAHERNLILEYNMTDFIPQIDVIDFHYLDEDETKEINDAITIGVVKRLEEIEDQEDFDSLYFDLEETQKFVENEGQQEDAYDLIIPIVNHIQDLQQVLDHFDNVDEMIDYLNGDWE
jgi:hypothetical protein